MPVYANPSVTERLARALSGHVPSDSEWLALIEVANAHLVTPRLHDAMRRKKALDRIDPEARAYLDLIRCRNTARNAGLRNEALHATRLLNRAGIEPLWIKGAARIAGARSPADCPRVLTDIDLVVSPASRDRAIRALMSAGYRDAGGLVSDHTIGNLTRGTAPGHLDLHDRLPGHLSDLLGTEVQAHAERVVRDGVVFYRPEPEIDIIINVVHELLHDRGLRRGTISLRYLLDIADQADTWATIGDHPAVRSALDEPGLALAIEIQDRMLTALFAVSGPGLGRTAKGAMLHARRLLKLRSRAFDGLEHALFRLRRAGLSDQVDE